MASIQFPDPGSGWAVDGSGNPAPNRTYTVYAAATGPTLATIYADSAGAPGAAIAGSTLTTDAYGYLPLFWGPTDGTDQVWVSDGTAPRGSVDAINRRRVKALEDGFGAGGGEPRLATTAIKTGAYTALVNQLVRVDLSAGSFAVSLPTSAASGDRVVVKVVAVSGTNTCTVQRQSTDTINVGLTSVSLSLADEAFTFTSNGAGIWTLSAGQKSLASLDSRYASATVAGKAVVRQDELVVNVEQYAVGNANYLHTDGLWYTDSSHTTRATDDTAAIRALVTAGAKNLWFGSRQYRVKWTEQNALLSWANANGVTIRGNGAALCDETVYTNSPTNPYTSVFDFDACQNIHVSGVRYLGPAITNPTVNHGYVGATYVRCKNGCGNIDVNATLTNLRYGVESGAYPTETEGYNTGFRIKMRTTWCAYPIAHYLAEDVQFDINADQVHRVAYLAGCVNVRGVARWADEYIADTCMLITDAKTGTGTSRGCSDLDVTSIDKGSTVFQLSTACAGIGLSRVDPGITYENIRIRVHTASTDTVSSTVGGFKLYSGAASLTTPPASFNWEPTIILRNIEVSGVMDHSAQTVDGNTAGDIFVRAWDTSSAHAATVDNLSFRDLIIKQSSGNTRGLYLEAPGVINNGLTLDGVQAPGATLNIYTSTTVPTTIRNSSVATLAGETIAPRLILNNSAIGAMSGTIAAVETMNTTIAGGGAFVRQKSTVLTLTGSAVTWTSAIPAGCLPLGVSGIITTTITGATGIRVGVGTDTGRYLNTNTLTAGFTFGPANQAATEQTLWWAGPSTLNIVATAKTSNFTGGAIKLVLTYFEFPAPTA